MMETDNGHGQQWWRIWPTAETVMVVAEDVNDGKIQVMVVEEGE